MTGFEPATSRATTFRRRLVVLRPALVVLTRADEIRLDST
jgi:hypothetical protein